MPSSGFVPDVVPRSGQGDGLAFGVPFDYAPRFAFARPGAERTVPSGIGLEVSDFLARRPVFPPSNDRSGLHTGLEGLRAAERDGSPDRIPRHTAGTRRKA
jgi:hypothetical protein